MKEKVTITNIAESLSISPSTVSRALKNHPSISECVKDKIFAKAKEMGYGRVSTLIKATNIVVIVPEIESAFYARIINTMVESINDAEYLVSIHTSGNSELREKAIISRLDLEKTACLVIARSMDARDSSHLERLGNRGVPIVMFNRVDYTIEAPKFIIDDYQESYRATQHLVAAGYKRIAFAAKHHDCSVFQDRERAYRDVLTESNLNIDEQLIIYSEQTKEDLTEVITRFLNAENRPDAMMLPNCYAAMQAISTAKLYGISVPNEMGIFSFDEDPFCKLSSPTITSIDRPLEAIGFDMAKLINRIINKRNYDRNMIAPFYLSDLIVRASTLRK